MFPLDPKLAKELAEERERELLEEVEADRLAEDELPSDEAQSDDYQPVTNSDNDLIQTHRHNRHIHDDKA